MSDLAELHAPLLPILQQILPQIPWPRAGLVLDLASGAGDKLPLLAESLGAERRFLALDRDRQVLSAIAPEGADRLVADAQALPLQAGSCAAICCIASFGLFTDPAVALDEMARVLAPDGILLLVTATQRWVPITRWPPALYTAMPQLPWLPPNPDLAGDLAEQLARLGWEEPRLRAFALDVTEPLASEAELLPWAQLHPLLQVQLAPDDLAAYAAAAAAAEPELRTLALIAYAHNTRC